MLDEAAMWTAAGTEAPSSFDPSVLINYGGVGILAAGAIAVVIYLAKQRDNDSKSRISEWETRAEEWKARETALLDQVRQVRQDGEERLERAERRADRLGQELSNLNIRVQTEVTTALGSAAKAVADALLFVQAGGRR